MGSLTIGSNALRYWFMEFPREPGDLDIWAPERPAWTETVPDECPIDLFWDDRLAAIVGDLAGDDFDRQPKTVHRLREHHAFAP